jgi:hypothetical protein
MIVLQRLLLLVQPLLLVKPYLPSGEQGRGHIKRSPIACNKRWAGGLWYSNILHYSKDHECLVSEDDLHTDTTTRR